MIKLTGLPRASMLLLGYAAEMYLKAGLVKIYTGCRNAMIDREVKAFGHDFVRIAKEISYPISQDIEDRLSMLKRFVEVDARYPVDGPQASELDMNVEYANSVNHRTGLMWSSKNFSELCALVKSIRIHAQKIDGDSGNPASFRRLELPRGGYLALRYGGNLESRVTYRAEAGRTEKRTLSEIQQLAIDQGWIEAKYYWPHFVVVEDGQKKTVKLHTP
jgi:hypothetical protein